MKEQTSHLLEMLELMGPRLHALLLRLTLREEVAEDLMQDLFIQLSRSDGFLRAMNPAGYAFRTATHLAFTWRRSLPKEQQLGDLADELEGRTSSPLESVVDRERLEQVLDAAAKLSALQRDAFLMRYVQRETFETIAHHLGRTPHQIRGLCHRAVGRIRDLLNEVSGSAPQKENPYVARR